MFKFVESRPESRDCTIGYNVELDQYYSVDSFIQTVLYERNNDWGEIRIKDGSLFGRIICEYKRGKIIADNTRGFLSKRVMTVTADGDWSRMDYMLDIEV